MSNFLLLIWSYFLLLLIEEEMASQNVGFVSAILLFSNISSLFFFQPFSSHVLGPFGKVYFSASVLTHAKVVSNTSFLNGFTSEVFFQNELEGMSQKKWLTRLQLTSFLHNSPSHQSKLFFLVLPSIPSHVQERSIKSKLYKSLSKKQLINRFAK
jgi:hypothetical protein